MSAAVELRRELEELGAFSIRLKEPQKEILEVKCVAPTQDILNDIEITIKSYDNVVEYETAGNAVCARIMN